jgi:hypothetical protein
MSGLPKFSYPQLTFKLPSTGAAYRFRPFLVKEEKILLLAKSSDDNTDILTAIKQVVNNCSLDMGFNVNTIAIFDLEYLFLKIRAASIESVIKVSYRDADDNEIYDFEVDLDKVEVTFPEGEAADPKIKLTDDAGILLKYPAATLYDDKKFLALGEDENQLMFELVARSIDQIYQGEKVYKAKDYKKEELMEFIEGLSIEVFEKIDNFLKNTPKMEHVLQYTNKDGTSKKIVLSSLNDFFTLR